MLGTVIQIDGWDPVAGAAIALRAASHDDAAVCHLDGATWWPAIAKLPTLRYDLFDGDFGGQITAPASSMSLRTEPWPDFARYSLADARFRLWTGEVGAPWSEWTLRFDGRLTARPAIRDGAAELAFAVDDRWLDTPLLATYAGTGGIEGPEALKGTVKPLALGAPRYVPGVLVDAIATIFQLSAYGAIVAVDEALEKLAGFGLPVADHPSFAALETAEIPRGRFATCRARGLVRFGAPTEGTTCFQVRGDMAGPDGWVRRPGRLIRRLAQLAGGLDRLSDSSLAALDAARPYNLSIYLDQQTTARDLIQRLAASINAVAGVSWLGKLFVLPVTIGASSLTLAADGSALPPVASVEELEIAAPWKRLAIGAERAWTVHQLSDVAFTAPLTERGAYGADTIYREGDIVSLPDGSRWLRQAAAPSAGVYPVEGATWALLAGKVQPKWEDIADPDGTKPTNGADKTSENTAADTAAVAGRPAAEVVTGLDRIEPIAEGQEILKASVVDQDALLRQADRDRARLAAEAMGGLLDQHAQRITLRDAGMVTDPMTGRIYLYGVDQAAERVSKVEIGLDAVTGEIALRATYDDVRTAIAEAQLSPGDAAQFGDIIRRLGSAEVSISGINRAIELKADAITVTRLGGIVQEVSQGLDALAGEIEAKVSYSDFTPLRDRVGSVELLLQSVGDISSYGVTVRQAELRADRQVVAGLADLVGRSEDSQRALVRSAQAQQQIYARLIEGDAVEAARNAALAAEIARAAARLATEELVRAREDSALSRLLTALSAELDDVEGGLTRLSEATSTADEVRARDILQLFARVGDFGLVSVQQAFSVLADRTGRLEGEATLVIDTAGNVNGWKLLGSQSGPGSLALINTDLKMGTGCVVMNNGVVMQVQGVAFGANRDLMEWFGPTMALDACTRANAITYKGTDGHIYSAAGFSAGGAQNGGRSTSLAPDAIATMGPFGTNGKRRVITASYTYFLERASISPGGGIDGSPTATLILERQDGAAWTQIGTISAAGSTEYQAMVGGDPGRGQQTMSGAVTVTEPASDSAGTATYRLRLTARGLAQFRFTSPNAGTEQQTLNLLSIEE